MGGSQFRSSRSTSVIGRWRVAVPRPPLPGASTAGSEDERARRRSTTLAATTGLRPTERHRADTTDSSGSTTAVSPTTAQPHAHGTELHRRFRTTTSSTTTIGRHNPSVEPRRPRAVPVPPSAAAGGGPAPRPSKFKSAVASHHNPPADRSTRTRHASGRSRRAGDQPSPWIAARTTTLNNTPPTSGRDQPFPRGKLASMRAQRHDGNAQLQLDEFAIRPWTPMSAGGNTNQTIGLAVGLDGAGADRAAQRAVVASEHIAVHYSRQRWPQRAESLVDEPIEY